MHRILTTKEMQVCDEDTCFKKKISSLKLMELAGKKLYECLIDNVMLDKEDHVLIVSGIGNNGGDSLIVGYYLVQNDYHVKIVIVGKFKNISEHIKTVITKLNKLNVDIVFIQDETNISSFENVINEATYVIDGLFGIGLNRNIDGIYYQVIERINQSNAFVYSIDIPSGINGNTGNVLNIAVKADLTAVIQNYKIGNLLNDAKDYHGEIHLLDIGILQDKITSKRFLSTKDELAILPKRQHNTHKYHYGSILTIGGNLGMTGAPLMSALAALRTGTGLSSIAIHTHYYPYIRASFPEIMIKPYQNEEDILSELNKKTAIAFGPGLGRNEEVNLVILEKLLTLDIPLVIDADGLYYLKSFLNTHINNKNIIITPHVGELATLLDKSSGMILDDPVSAVNEIIEKSPITVVLKGPCTIIATQDVMYFSPYGNPGMATAGSGDVLTGIITSLVGQGLDIIEACKLGVYIHSKAGHFACEELGEYGMMASDIISYLPKSIKLMV